MTTAGLPHPPPHGDQLGSPRRTGCANGPMNAAPAAPCQVAPSSPQLGRAGTGVLCDAVRGARVATEFPLVASAQTFAARKRAGPIAPPMKRRAK